jgi:hypothetical protein
LHDPFFLDLQPNVQLTPEPSTVLLSGMGFLGLAILAGRRWLRGGTPGQG